MRSDRFQEGVRHEDDEDAAQLRDFYPLYDKVFGGEEGWDAPGMELYDDYDKHRPA